MQRLKQYLLTTIGLLVVAAAFVMLTPSAGHGKQQVPPTQVIVANTANLPVPTSATGTTTIAGTVHLADGSTVALAPESEICINPNCNKVRVVNTVSVHDVDNPARSPYQTELSFDFTPDDFHLSQDIVVPAGKRLVIEYASASAFTFVKRGESIATNAIVGVSIATSVGGATAKHQLPFTDTQIVPEHGFTPAHKVLTAGQQMRLYADPGSTIRVAASVESSAISFVQVSLSGYFVNLP